MIIANISGGLGNQLFQYAAAKALALHHNVELKLDISHFEEKSLRKFELDNFNCQPSIATAEELLPFRKKSIIYRAAQKLLPPHKRKPFKQPGFEYYPRFLEAPSNTYLKGNWQSEKYFMNIQDVLRSEFVVSPKLVAHLKNKSIEMENEHSVSVHIRRGDYLNPSTLKYHGVLPVEYYKNAIAKIQSSGKDYKFYFFSDDIEWTKNNLVYDFPHEHISNVITKNHFEDFYLMSSCRNNIIANSSFSWWCARLNPNPEKIVVAPKKWFNEARANTKDLIPAEWFRI
jgi:hypothetical protein